MRRMAARASRRVARQRLPGSLMRPAALHRAVRRPAQVAAINNRLHHPPGGQATLGSRTISSAARRLLLGHPRPVTRAGAGPLPAEPAATRRLVLLASRRVAPRRLPGSRMPPAALHQVVRRPSRMAVLSSRLQPPLGGQATLGPRTISSAARRLLPGHPRRVTKAGKRQLPNAPPALRRRVPMASGPVAAHRVPVSLMLPAAPMSATKKIDKQAGRLAPSGWPFAHG